MSDISIIVRKMRTFAERNMAHRGIGFPEQLVLMSLLANGESNQESIAAEHGIDRGAIAKTLAKLEAKGLVTRKVNSKNKREKIVCATPEATSVFDEMRASFVELDNTLFSGFTPEEKASACDLIARMAANLQEVDAAPVSAATAGDTPAAASASPADAAATGKESL